MAERLAAAEIEPGPTLPAEAAEPTYSATVVEPDWFADGDFSWLDAADIEARSQPEMIAVEIAASPAAPEEEAEPAPEPIAEPEVVAEVVAEPVAEPQPEATVAFEEMEPVEVSGGEEAVMWLGEPPAAADAMEIASSPAHPEASPAPRSWDPLEPVAWPAGDRSAPATQAVAPPLAMTEEELAQLARDEGWDDAEVSAIRAMISRPSSRTVELPGSAELDEAMSALQAVPIGPRADDSPGRKWAKPTTPDAATSGYDDWAFAVDPSSAQALAPQPQPAARRAADPNWLRQRRGPAASAYRRIRRIFTG